MPVRIFTRDSRKTNSLRCGDVAVTVARPPHGCACRVIGRPVQPVHGRIASSGSAPQACVPEGRSLRVAGCESDTVSQSLCGAPPLFFVMLHILLP
ncbi:hypothetical protein OH687_31195 [Burkholderia anthina]|nr:hypothetical protein OH687_31195 [Burkholderia anthina]